MELQPLSREHIDGIMEIENDSFSIPWSRGSMEKNLKINIMLNGYILTSKKRMDINHPSYYLINIICIDKTIVVVYILNPSSFFLN